MEDDRHIVLFNIIKIFESQDWNCSSDIFKNKNWNELKETFEELGIDYDQ